MKSIGATMAFLGAGSFALHYLEREFTLLMWIDNWGPTVGNAIRVGMIVVGGAMWYFGADEADEEEAEEPAAE